jgi:ATP-dependent HslUV protease subunit HslV
VLAVSDDGPDVSDERLRDTAALATTPLGCDVEREVALPARAGVLPEREALARLELDDTERLGRSPEGTDDEGPERELEDSDDPPPDDPPDDPPEPDPEDEPELAVVRGTACAASPAGAASARPTENVTANRVERVMELTPQATERPATADSGATLLPRCWVRNRRVFRASTGQVSPGLALPRGRHYDAFLATLHATTVLGVRHQGKVVLASDGQVTLGQTVVKHRARKVRRLYQDRVLAGFAGSAADGFALFSRFEAKLEEHRGNLERASVELARDWRTDRLLRRLEAMMLVADTRAMYLLSGTGDLIEPDDGVMGIGSGGAFAMAAARALVGAGGLDARAIVERAMTIAAEICVYTNSTVVFEEL